MRVTHLTADGVARPSRLTAFCCSRAQVNRSLLRFGLTTLYCSRIQRKWSLLGLGLAAADCTPRTPALIVDATAAGDDGPIPLGPDAQVQAVLTSNVPATAFTISGVAADTDLVLPRTSIVRVLLPRAGVTITARTTCFRTQKHFVQVGSMNHGDPISFTFSNNDRRGDCIDEAMAPSAAIPPRVPDPGRLAWVIGNGQYEEGWPALGIVAEDRSQMAATLQRAGYQVRVSADRPWSDLRADAAAFREALMRANPRIAIIYVSGHGVSLDATNYLVPINAPPPGLVRPEHLFGIDQLVEILRPVEAAGGCAVLLVDACRSVPGAQVQPLTAEPPRGILVNHSTAPGGTSFDGDRGMSAWTERFVTIAADFPDAQIDQLLGYANRYTRWQSEASRRIQTPVLYGRPAMPTPAFGAGVPPRRGILPRLPSPGAAR